jgi:hypothetical protein
MCPFFNFDAKKSLYDPWLLPGRNQPILAGYSHPSNFRKRVPFIVISNPLKNQGLYDDMSAYGLA